MAKWLQMLFRRKTRLGDLFNNSTIRNLQSVGKTLTGYLMGHAICQGYISGLDQTLPADWPLMQGTPYENKKIIDLINMNVGDMAYVRSNSILCQNPDNGLSRRRSPNHALLGSSASRQAEKLAASGFNYSQLVS